MLGPEEKKKLQTRLNRAQGQVAAIHRMLDDDAYCVDVLLQISAAQAALGQIGKVVLAAHMNSCVSEAFAGNDANARRTKIDELLDVFSRYGHLGARRSGA